MPKIQASVFSDEEFEEIETLEDLSTLIAPDEEDLGDEDEEDYDPDEEDFGDEDEEDYEPDEEDFGDEDDEDYDPDEEDFGDEDEEDYDPDEEGDDSGWYDDYSWPEEHQVSGGGAFQFVNTDIGVYVYGSDSENYQISTEDESGKSGDDWVSLWGSGNDTVSLGAGNDGVFLGDGDDIADGGSGNDYMDGWVGNDTLSGGDGDDFIWSYDGDDVIDGGNGNDTLDGEAGNDHISGGEGDDLLRASEGADTLDGGAGNDTIVISPNLEWVFSEFPTYTMYVNEDGTIQCGSGYFYGFDIVRITNEDLTVSGGAGEDTLSFTGGWFGGFSLSDLTGVEQNGDDLILNLADGFDVTVQNQFVDDLGIEQFTFDDATLSAADMMELLNPPVV